MIRSVVFTLSALASVALATAAVAAEGPHSGHPQKVVIVDNQRLVPANTTMKADEVLVFENQSVHPMRITFTDPANSAERVRCDLLNEPADKRPPWGLFDASDGKLTGTIPPGRFASLCALQPGNYAFTAERQGAEGNKDPGELAMKGQVKVQ